MNCIYPIDSVSLEGSNTEDHRAYIISLMTQARFFLKAVEILTAHHPGMRSDNEDVERGGLSWAAGVNPKAGNALSTGCTDAVWGAQSVSVQGVGSLVSEHVPSSRG